MNSIPNQLINLWTVVAIATCALGSNICQAQQATTFEVTLEPNIQSAPVDGRLLVFVSKRNPNPMRGPNWFNPDPFFGIDVKETKPGDKITVDDSADAFPQPLSKLPPGEYNVQAILHHNFYAANHGNGPGNFYSKAKRVSVNGAPIQLNLNQVVPPRSLRDSTHAKLVEVKSDLLSKFHQRDVVERALVVLPASYQNQPERRYPVYYDVTGFGGTLEQLNRQWGRGQPATNSDQAEFIRVFLTGQCRWGHHVYANSATNGPRGDALVQETIHEIDKRFRTIAEPTARFVGGHSSGGWSSLWLQVNYPEFFGGVWSTSPDPVDFRDWQGTNLYAENANVYFDEDGQKRPLARFGNRVMAYYKNFTQMDDVLGHGGQIRSFDAVFSPKTVSGQPAHCWNRETGIVDPAILEHWKKYDISLILKNNWSSLAKRLESKIHVFMGDKDTFYLEGATIKLGERMKELGSDAVVEIFPGKDHSSVLTPTLRTRIMTEMSEQFWKHHPQPN